MSNKKVLLDKDLAEITGIPAATLSKWKHSSADNWRKTVYESIRTSASFRNTLSRVRKEISQA